MADDLPELLGICQALEWQPMATGRRVGVISTSGGGCSLVADALARHGLEVPELEPAVQDALRDVLPSYAPTRNPIDTTGNIAGDPSLARRILGLVLASGRVDIAVVAVSALVGETARVIAADIVELSTTTDKPIVVGWMLPEAVVAEAFALLRTHRIPVFDSVRLACIAAGALTPPRARAPIPCAASEPAGG